MQTNSFKYLSTKALPTICPVDKTIMKLYRTFLPWAPLLMVAFWSNKNEGLIVASTDFVYNAESRTTQPFVFQFSSLFKNRKYSEAKYSVTLFKVDSITFNLNCSKFSNIWKKSDYSNFKNENTLSLHPIVPKRLLVSEWSSESPRCPLIYLNL